MPEQITEASASTPTLSANTDRVANSPATQCAMPHTALPSEMPPSDAIQSSPPALVHSKLPYTDAQTDSLPGVARPNSHRQGSNECGCLKQDSLTAADPRNSSLKNTSPELASPTMKAMQALDLASIMGAPAEMLGPILSRTEPLARQAHQASLAQQNSHGLHQIHTAPHTDLSAQQQEDPFSCATIPPTLPEDLPHLDPDKLVARRNAADLTAADFKRLYWKTDTPVVITGAMQNWKAMRKWASLQWWSENHGHRTIPVELGTDSTQTWRETTLLLHAFMKGYMHPSIASQPDAEVAYIAQHPLFDQMPSLLPDFDQPELMGSEAMQMNAWIGTKGTVTPLHFDSYDNFLAQDSVCDTHTHALHMPQLPWLQARYINDESRLEFHTVAFRSADVSM
ncbi:hypothetical protein ABBQ32_004209 [Trebouxia sp. C0010 RCD-2024]